MSSQRTDGFKAGIQSGMTATDIHSKKLDQQVNNISKKIANYTQVKTRGIKYQNKLKQFQIPGGIGSCSPDGGVWLDKNGKIIAAFEAKKQGEIGNAIERWFKNEHILRKINPMISYVTFCCGMGAKSNCILEKTLNIVVLNKNSIYLSHKGFTDNEIEKIMLDTILG